MCMPRNGTCLVQSKVVGLEVSSVKRSLTVGVNSDNMCMNKHDTTVKTK